MEQDFNSLDAQREAAEAFIKSQAHEGWRLRRDRYDDGGFSGGSMDRPALQQLLADVVERRIDIVVVYKVDRLTRALADFAKLVELFDGKGVSFVSVTQSFNTTTSMGRLTLNVLLSFAQFEREVTGRTYPGQDRRLQEKRHLDGWGRAARLQGREAASCWSTRSKLRRSDSSFGRYLELGSLPALQRDLRERGIMSRSRVLSSGRSDRRCRVHQWTSRLSAEESHGAGRTQPPRSQLQERASRYRHDRAVRRRASQAGAKSQSTRPAQGKVRSPADQAAYSTTATT